MRRSCSLFPSPSGISVLQMVISGLCGRSERVSVPFGDIGSSNENASDRLSSGSRFRPLRGYRFFKSSGPAYGPHGIQFPSPSGISVLQMVRTGNTTATPGGFRPLRGYRFFKCCTSSSTSSRINVSVPFGDIGSSNL